jgi:hypothetical protein
VRVVRLEWPVAGWLELGKRLGETKYPGSKVFFVAHMHVMWCTLRELCAAPYMCMKEVCSRPHAVLTGLTGALEHMTGELPSRTLGDGTYARIRYRIDNCCCLMDVDFRGNFDSSSPALAMKNLGRARAFATRRHGKLQVWEFSER